MRGQEHPFLLPCWWTFGEAFASLIIRHLSGLAMLSSVCVFIG